MLFAVLAVAAQLDRDYIRDKTLEGQAAAAARGNHGGRPPVFDADMLVFARVLRANGTPMPEIVAKLAIATGKNAGTHPSVASLYRALVNDIDPSHRSWQPNRHTTKPQNPTRGASPLISGIFARSFPISTPTPSR